MSFLRDILENCHPIVLKINYYMFHFVSSLSLISAKTLQNWNFTKSNLKLQNHTDIIVMYLLVVQIVRHMSLCVLWQL